MGGNKKKPVKPETERLMRFRNNYYAGLANGDATQYLTPEQKQWLETIKECQKSVKVYTNQEYASKVNPDFNKPGNFIVNEFFENAGIANEQVQADKAVHHKLAAQNVFAPEKNRQVDDARQYTKYRVIVSKVPFMNADGTLEIRKVITTCAPNLMNSSPADEKEFVRNGKLNVQAYDRACNKIAALIVHAAKANGMDPLDVAEFGLGVYLNAFNHNPEQKELARACMYKAFASAAKTHGVKVNWLIYGHPEKASAKADELNNKYNFSAMEFKSGDIMKSQNSLNNGSDRTIGGKSNHVNPATTEEQLAQCSFLIEIQTMLNPALQNNLDQINTQVDVSELLSQKKLDGYSIMVNKREQTVRMVFSNSEQANALQETLDEKSISARSKTENDPITITLSKQDFDSVRGAGSYDKLVLHEFLEKHQLYPSTQNLDYWASQTFTIGKFGGTTYTIGDKSWQIPHSVHEIMTATTKAKTAEELIPLITQTVTTTEKRSASFRKEATICMLNDAAQLSPKTTSSPTKNPGLTQSSDRAAEQANPTRQFKDALQNNKQNMHGTQLNPDQPAKRALKM